MDELHSWATLLCHCSRSSSLQPERTVLGPEGEHLLLEGRTLGACRNLSKRELNDVFTKGSVTLHSKSSTAV